MLKARENASDQVAIGFSIEFWLVERMPRVFLASKAKPKKSRISLNTQLKCPSLVFWQNNPEEGKLSSSSVNKALAELSTVDLLKR